MIRHNIPDAQAFADTVARQIPFATALALTRTAQDAQKNHTKRIPRVFDKPTPFTRRAIGIKRASKYKPVASVFVKDKQAGYLIWQERGGTRYPAKRAHIIPRKVRLNKYGNIPNKSIQRQLAKDNVFSAKIKRAAGIWQRMKSGKLKFLVQYIPRAKYKKRFRFIEVSRKTAAARFPVQFRRALDHAIATAR